MSEERMERKCVARSVPAKAAQGDSKKSSDAVHKPWPRSGKKREGGSGGSKNDLFRRNVPAARGGGRGGQRGQSRAGLPAVGGAQGSGLATEEAELGSVFVPGSKKQSLNHLLNFVYSPRERAGDFRSPRTAPPRRNNARARVAVRGPSAPHLFLHASCQFAVKAGVDYSEHLVNPDAVVDWAHVEHVLLRGEGATDCPVCLCAPVAPRVTRCGHVYCWPCVLHYARVHHHPRPPCPVCAVPLHLPDLRSASALPWPQPHQEMIMRLVRRARGSTLVEPAPEREASIRSVPSGRPAPPEWSRHCDLPYTKMFVITTQEMRDIIAREGRELSDQILAEIDTSELEYLEEAQRLLADKLLQLDTQPAIFVAPLETAEPVTVLDTSPSVEPGRKFDWFDVDEDGPSVASVAEDLASVTEDVASVTEDVGSAEEEEGACALNPEAREFVLEEAREFVLEEAGEPRDEAPVLTEADKENQAKYFYFYQGADGQHVFLHGVDVRLLSASWGALAAAPSVVRGRLLRRECYALTYESREHMPCTAHLPSGCPYDVVELDLQPPYVTRSALNLFSEELERRTRARVRAEREERRRERRAAAASRAPLAPRLTSLAHFPPARAHSPVAPPLPPSPVDIPAQSPPGLSFAKMASGSGTWRAREPRPPTPPPAPADEDGATASAPRLLSLSDAIEAALHASPAPSTSSSRGAKKKNKPKLLFSTGVQRAA